MKKIFEHWKELRPFEKVAAIGALIGIFAALYGGYSFIENKTKDTKERIVIFNKKTHLGDNDQANLGGTSSPYVESPGAEDGAHLLIFDKSKNSFLSTNGFPTEIQSILNHYGKRYNASNLSAYKHVLAVDSSYIDTNQYQGNSVQIDQFTKLIWKENSGSFYHEKAAVGITSTLNLFNYFKGKGLDPQEVKIKKSTFWYHGLHSGKRDEQKDNVELVVNNSAHILLFKSNKVREEELVSISINPELLNLSPTSTNRFTLVVLPYQEKLPIPPTKQEKYKRIGPGHFRDIELWNGTLELIVD
ncbi:hypothetical protein [uncultured Desulfuromusa sp.]|uniref:hypothetical protein n=1 Tax=uncultured Desulfuromusa sp. TaxID=219183 RepID=UPI002AA8C884|nr:hypothetical protein [uncultured Desulfuromusa sp.]